MNKQLSSVALAVLLVYLGVLSRAQSTSSQNKTTISAEPKTKPEFLEQFGKSDSSRALIRYYYARRGSAQGRNLLGVLIGSGGLVTPLFVGERGLPMMTLAAPGLGLFVWGKTDAARYSPRRLYSVLTMQRMESQKIWRKALDGYGPLRPEELRVPTSPAEARQLQRNHKRRLARLSDN